MPAPGRFWRGVRAVLEPPLHRRCRALVLCALCAVACTPKPPALPSGAGTPFPDFEPAYAEAVAECRSARTAVAELALSGRAGREKLRGRISAGITATGDIRLEAVAFGRAIFVLAGRDGRATLLLIREDRVVRDESAAIVEAITGVALTPADLVNVIAGCGLGAGSPANGRTFNEQWAAVDVSGGTTYLRRTEQRWRVAGAVRGDLQVLYTDVTSGMPSVVQIRAGSVADITLRVSQLEINTTIEAKAFEVNVPADAVPLTLEELRRAGPLGDR
jgi:hypothetical protein